MGLGRAFRRVTRGIGRLGGSASGRFIGRLTGKKKTYNDTGEGYQGIDPNQYEALQNKFGQLQNQYDTLNNQFNQMMNQYKAIAEKNNGLQSAIDDKDKSIQQEKSKYDALNQAIGERGKFDQSVDEGNGQGAGENSYGINKKEINFTNQVNPNGDIKDDDDIKRRLSRILQERGQMR